ncbi:glutamine ABC transporter ATP-binding protein [Enterobacter cloacae]|uniref:Glutamine ABC transporter ATP-binding protein n=1 Tax=Enterobacter cloacae TaxID=550 RepID=A0A377M659_ENTCL|nr:glutamine ABC transporter ATP-binding protein [Enterobacter cloacae]
MFGPLRVRGANKAAAEALAKDLLAKVASQNVLTTTLQNFPVDNSSVWLSPARWRLNRK